MTNIIIKQTVYTAVHLFRTAIKEAIHRYQWQNQTFMPKTPSVHLVGHKRCLFYKLLQPNKTVTPKHGRQTNYFANEIEHKRLFTEQGSQKVSLLRDNTKPHVVLRTQ